jgi:nitrite reductase (NADH) small subunit
MATGLVRLCSVSELPPEGGVHEVEAGSQAFCVARLNGKISVLDNECPHHGGPLGEGMIEGGKVVCPWHAYAFDLVTGVCDDLKEQVRVYAVSTSGEDVMVNL